jgi:hypothetical protein
VAAAGSQGWFLQSSKAIEHSMRQRAIRVSPAGKTLKLQIIIDSRIRRSMTLYLLT